MDIDILEDRGTSGPWKDTERSLSLLSRIRRPLVAPFRVRAPERDANTDGERIGKLTGLVRSMKSEIAAERDGLRSRLERDAGDAAFLLHTIANEEPSARQTSRVDALQTAIIHAGERDRKLSQQLTCVEEIEELLKKLKTEV